jgi:hypothetical protein
MSIAVVFHIGTIEMRGVTSAEFVSAVRSGAFVANFDINRGRSAIAR